MAAQLKEALTDCIINFDRRVLVTDLLNEYQLPYSEIDGALKEFIADQEKKGTKYEKRFLVHGEEAASKNEIFTIVKGENKLNEWLEKLKNAESSLYSVELVGGAKSLPEDLKPIRFFATKTKDVKLRVRASAMANGQTNGDVSAMGDSKNDIKEKEAKKRVEATGTKKICEPSTSGGSNTMAETKPKVSPEAKTHSPEEKKTETKSAQKKKGSINNFFASSNKAQEMKQPKATGVIRQKTPKKMQDFFKKDTQSPSGAKDVKQEVADVSVELFGEEEIEEAKVMEVESSDEDEKLEAIKRNIKNSDDEEEPSTSISKRRRIEDSDEEEEQPKGKKQEKVEVKTETEPVRSSETYLDDDGFVITIKSKKSNVKKSPIRLSKSPMKTQAKPKPSTQPSAKTKQGSITNFFSKK